MKLDILHFEKTVGQELCRELTSNDSIGITPRKKLPEYSDPSLVRLDCVNCTNLFYALLYKNQDGPELVIFSVRGGGVSTPNTPVLVRYYLEQAYRAQAASAYSAALTMYRGALEQLLADKGFKGKLQTKMTELTKKIENGSSPIWAKRLNVAAFMVIKKIADSHAHPSELAKLQALDAAFMSNVQKAFCSLLKVAYEEEHWQATQKEKLKVVLLKAKTEPYHSSNQTFEPIS